LAFSPTILLGEKHLSNKTDDNPFLFWAPAGLYAAIFCKEHAKGFPLQSLALVSITD